ncbi:hypothetical protein [Bradyrhizobium sp. CCBAU 53421]|uniref:hypothetical protein n=1 Tax=Bradyrhizobium sp. CCBAU 53421 TaxID=1325120 RepID=UPI0018C19913|nr:hypothetical protein [Bradyrhizobium sp. CCBAU 53421]QOZ36545.1 hypothetical protein XH92_37230 [Bradyrhizobium sp. CCBAU 53421]
MTGSAILENVRRYRAIASLCRQAAAFRPIQRISLLTQADEWEQRAVNEIEEYFDAQGCPTTPQLSSSQLTQSSARKPDRLGASGGQCRLVGASRT